MRFSLPRLRMPQLSLPRLRLPRLPGMFIFAWLFAALKGWVMGSRPKDNDSLVMYDRMLLWLTFGLAAIGFIMVTSASMPVGQRLANDPFLFAKRDGLYIVLAFVLALVTLRLPMDFWQRHSTAMLIASIVMLLIVLVVGSSVNGASRWIALNEGWASAMPGLATIRSAASSQVSLRPPTWHSTDSGNLSSPGGATRVSITRGVTPRAMKKSTHDRPVMPSPIMTTFLP